MAVSCQWRRSGRCGDITRVQVQCDPNRVNHISRLLETANVKAGCVVASNIVGKSGRTILGAMAAGRTRPEVLAVGHLKSKR